MEAKKKKYFHIVFDEAVASSTLKNPVGKWTSEVWSSLFVSYRMDVKALCHYRFDDDTGNKVGCFCIMKTYRTRRQVLEKFGQMGNLLVESLTTKEVSAHPVFVTTVTSDSMVFHKGFERKRARVPQIQKPLPQEKRKDEEMDVCRASSCSSTSSSPEHTQHIEVLQALMADENEMDREYWQGVLNDHNTTRVSFSSDGGVDRRIASYQKMYRSKVRDLQKATRFVLEYVLW